MTSRSWRPSSLGRAAPCPDLPQIVRGHSRCADANELRHEGNFALVRRVSQTFASVWIWRNGMTGRDYIRVGVVVALFAFGTACADDRGSRASEEASPSAPTSTTSPDESLPASNPSEKGARVALYTHCGVVSLTVKGRLWLADPPLRDSSHNPPQGWDENQTMGVFLITGSGRGVFQGDEGQRAVFRRAPLGAEDPNAGCE